jgi:phosphoglycerate dehydrogenase-like enzyme
MRLSRWGRSAYDTDAHWAAEADALAALVTVVPPHRDAEVIVVNSKTRVDAALLARAPSARVVVTSTSGYEHLDLDVIRAHGARACRLPEARRDAVVEASLELILTGLRQTDRLMTESRAGRWARGALPHLPIRTLRGARVGLVGLGVIGRAMVPVLRAFGADVVGTDPAGLPADVPDLPLAAQVATCDVVSLHAALRPQDRGLVSAELLARARPGLVLVNTARGELVDVDAAVRAVRAGRLGALGVDVFPEEPWPRLRDAGEPGVVFTPHSAGWHAGLPDRVTSGLRRVLEANRAGGPLPYRLA